jgi:hypothetical protein
MRVQRDDVCKTLQSTCFELPGELRHDVEAPGLGGSVESAGERRLDLVFARFGGGRIAPRLPHAWVNTADLGSTRIAAGPCFLDRPRIPGSKLGFRFRRREA